MICCLGSPNIVFDKFSCDRWMKRRSSPFDFANGAQEIIACRALEHVSGRSRFEDLTDIFVIIIHAENEYLHIGMSIVQMPAGIPVATLAIGRAGAVNAALLAAAMLANKYPLYRDALRQYRLAQTQAVLEQPDPRGI